MTSAQLSLLGSLEPDRIVTGGLLASAPPGPARLLSALVKRGLKREYLGAAAALCLALDEGAAKR